MVHHYGSPAVLDEQNISTFTKLIVVCLKTVKDIKG